MNIKLLTEHHLEFLCLTGGYTGSYESTFVKMPHCWKSHVVAHIRIEINILSVHCLDNEKHELNIYIFNVAALDETIIPSCLHFSMQNIEQSRGLGRASRWSNVNVNQ